MRILQADHWTLTPCVFFQIRAITYETRHRHAYRDSLGLRAVRRVGTQEVAVRRLVLGRGHRQQAGVWRDPRVSNAEPFKVCWLWRQTGDRMHSWDWTTDVGELGTLVTVVAWCFCFVHPGPSLVIGGFSRTAWGGQRSNVEVTVTKLLSKSRESDFFGTPGGSFFKSGTKHFADKKLQVTFVTTRDKALYQSSIEVFCKCLQHVSHRKLLSDLRYPWPVALTDVDTDRRSVISAGTCWTCSPSSLTWHAKNFIHTWAALIGWRRLWNQLLQTDIRDVYY